MCTIATATTKIDGYNEKLGGFRWLKVLVAGTGDEYLTAAKNALEYLGFKVAKVSGSRTDLIAVDDVKVELRV